MSALYPAFSSGLCAIEISCIIIIIIIIMADEVNTIFVHDNRVRFKVSPNTRLVFFNYMAYIVYKWQGHGHHKMKIPRIDAVKGLKGLVLSYVDKSE